MVPIMSLSGGVCAVAPRISHRARARPSRVSSVPDSATGPLSDELAADLKKRTQGSLIPQVRDFCKEPVAYCASRPQTIYKARKRSVKSFHRLSDL